MLDGTHPFTGANPSEIRVAIVNDRMTPLHAHLPDGPATWQHFLEKALAFNPASRPQSALQLLSEFKQDILCTG